MLETNGTNDGEWIEYRSKGFVKLAIMGIIRLW